MTVNVALLTRTLDYIEQHPEQWDQGAWAVEYHTATTCKSAFCFAGWAVQLNGHTINFAPVTSYYGEKLIEYIDGGEPIQTVAQRDLGLTPDQAERLFNGDNTLDELQTLVNEFINEAVVTEFVNETLPTNEPALVA